MVRSKQSDAKEILVTTSPASVPAEPGAAGSSPLRKPIAIAAAVCAAVLLAGGALGYLAGRHSGSSASTAAFSGPPGAGGFAGPPNGGGRGFDGAGGITGEQHIHGTLGAVGGSTITVETSSGSTTYTVTPTTTIIRNGQQTSLSDLKSGERVLVHVYPGTSGKLQIEGIFAGTLPTGGPGFGGPPQGGGGQGKRGQGGPAGR
jgi:hypothetical protein